MIDQQTVQLSRKGTIQILNIPVGFELSSNEVLVRKEGDRLIVEPVKRGSLKALLMAFAEEDRINPLEEEFPDVDEGLLPLDDIEI